MRNLAIPLSLIAGLLCLALRQEPTHQAAIQAAEPAGISAENLLRQQPTSFIPNLGQWDLDARYIAKFGAMTVYLQENGWTFTLVDHARNQPHVEEQTKQGDPFHSPKANPSPTRGVAVRMRFKNASTEALVPLQQQPGVHNYFLGNKPESWRTEVPLYGAVQYLSMQPGVDILARQLGGQFEYDLMLQPEAKLERIQIAVEGIEGMHLDTQGALILETVLGPVRMPPPPSWESGPSGEKSEVVVRYVLHGDHCFGFDVPSRRPGWSLVVDPGLVWSTVLGGGGYDYAYAIALDAKGAVTLAGQVADGWAFPRTPGAFDPTHNGGSNRRGDGFITRLNPSGSSLIYSSFIGGTGEDEATAIALGADGTAIVSGWTTSNDFPTTASAFKTVHNGGYLDAFVARISPSGSKLVYSTYLGGTNNDVAQGIAVDSQYCATVVGWTQSADYAVTKGSFQTKYKGIDAFVTRLSPTGTSLTYSTFLGGRSEDYANAVAVDAQGAATVTGQTNSTDFPTTPGALATTSNGQADAFVTRLSLSGATLVYSTYLGGGAPDWATALAMDAQGAVFVAGSTASFDFPATPGVYDEAKDSNYQPDAFVAKLSPSGSSLVYATYLGGSGTDYGRGIALDATGSVTVVGSTITRDFPTTPGALSRTNSGTFLGSSNAFVTRLSPSGTELTYSTYLGGRSNSEANAVVSDAQGTVTVTGSTYGKFFPTTAGAFRQVIASASSDVFVTRIDIPPSNRAIYGVPSAGCWGWPVISANSIPRVGNSAFAVTCWNAPPNAIGGLLIGGERFTSAQAVLGIELLVSWSGPFFFVGSARSDQVGITSYSLPIPAHPSIQLLDVYTQFVWYIPSSSWPCPPRQFSATSALHLTVR